MVGNGGRSSWQNLGGSRQGQAFDRSAASRCCPGVGRSFVFGGGDATSFDEAERRFGTADTRQFGWAGTAAGCRVTKSLFDDAVFTGMEGDHQDASTGCDHLEGGLETRLEDREFIVDGHA